ncbi:Protein of unknown function [Tardiphaga sp. OK246]|uniref:DUF3037 domain-containing protein n=1 Tax=Tardiphaga sp. OK246 TaxID=1855307 RepID=UPI000B6598D3|nr:DUF3037 domain-containing protein [Tardiphaga sp. OK246]SNT11659.1 Protein of unknown function [Tardiphaga sp. OK246]
MSAMQGYYALLQFSPLPERFEFVNIGVLLVAPSQKFVGIKYSQGLKRVERLFGKQPASSFDVLKEAFEQRIKVEILENWNIEKIESFAKLRANKMRISKILPAAFADPEKELDELFHMLVGENEIGIRLPKVQVELRKKFEKAGVSLLVEKPQPVKLPEGVVIDAPYAYQNGAYNLIDAVRLNADSADALAQASKRAIEGQWLRRHSQKLGSPNQLIVVGDLAKQPSAFVRAVDEMMKQHQVRFYELNNVEPLIQDIRLQARVHSQIE